MALTLYELLRNKIRDEFNLTDTDIGDTLMEVLFKAVMKEYSRSRGIRTYKKITFTAEEDTYILDAEIFYVEDCFWNDSFPSNFIDSDYTEDQYYNPTLRILDHIRDRIYEDNTIVDDQHFDIYRDGTDKKIKFDPVPETDIYVVGRKLHTKDTYPEQDEQIIESRFKALVLGHCQSTGLVVTIGDVTYDHKRMDREINRLNKIFYGHMQTVKIGR